MKNIGVMGLGSIGMRHAKNLRAMGHVVRAYDPDMKRRLAFNGVLWSEEEVYESDAIIIASPTNLHFDHAYKAISLGKPCFIEKPIATKYVDADLLMCKEIQFQQNIFVGYNLRFHSCVKQAKKWLLHDEIGEPLWANFTLGQRSIKEPYLRDGVILNWSHEIDLALYLLGSADVAASSTRLTDGKDDIADILLTHANGCRSTVHLDYVTEPEVRQGIIVGSKAQIIFDLLNRNAWLRSSDGVLEHFEGDDDWNDNYIEEMEAFLDRTEGKTTLGCTGEEALEVLKICLEVRKAAGLK